MDSTKLTSFLLILTLLTPTLSCPHCPPTTIPTRPPTTKPIHPPTHKPHPPRGPIVHPPVFLPPVIGKPPSTGNVPCPPSPPTPTPVTPTPTPVTPVTPTPSAPATCPIDTLKLGACVDLLGGLVHIGIGDPAVNQCCPLLEGLVEIEAAVCLCTTIRLKLLNINLYLPLALQLLLTCGKTPPPGYTCTI